MNQRFQLFFCAQLSRGVRWHLCKSTKSAKLSDQPSVGIGIIDKPEIPTVLLCVQLSHGLRCCLRKSTKSAKLSVQPSVGIGTIDEPEIPTLLVCPTIPGVAPLFVYIYQKC